MDVLLETERLILRRFTKADVHDLFGLDNDPEVMRYINGGTPTTLDVVKHELLPSFLLYDELRPAIGFWALVEKVDTRGGASLRLPILGDCEGARQHNFLGWVSLRPVDDEPAAASLGYRLHRHGWGMGYATEGARALIDEGFRTLAIDRVVATTYEENVASMRVMERLGMRLVRRFRLTTDDLLASDTHHVSSLDLWDGDDLEYALTRADWAAR